MSDQPGGRPGHEITWVRPLVTASAGLLLIGGIVIQVGLVSSVAASDITESAGDFFVSVGASQLVILLFAVLAVGVAGASRLVARDEGAAPTGGALIPLGAALLATSGIVFAGGAFLTLIARATDSGSDVEVEAGAWILMAGATIAAFAALVLAIAGLLASSRQRVRRHAAPTGTTLTS